MSGIILHIVRRCLSFLKCLSIYKIPLIVIKNFYWFVIFRLFQILLNCPYCLQDTCKENDGITNKISYNRNLTLEQQKWNRWIRHISTLKVGEFLFQNLKENTYNYKVIQNPRTQYIVQSYFICFQHHVKEKESKLQNMSKLLLDGK